MVRPRASPRPTVPAVEEWRASTEYAAPKGRTTDHRARLVDAAFADQPADPRAADHEILVADRIDLLGLEAVAAAERAQQREVAGAVVAEQKIRADPDFRDAQPLDEHGADEALRIPARQLWREADDGGALDVRGGDRFELLRLGHQERWRLVRPHDPRRMRIERHHDRRGTALGGDPAEAVENLPVAAVYPVEVPEREHRLLPAGGPHIVGKV